MLLFLLYSLTNPSQLSEFFSLNPHKIVYRPIKTENTVCTKIAVVPLDSSVSSKFENLLGPTKLH
jgi:hypothetical protein